MQEKYLYPVVEHFYTIQGEGFHAGKAAYFLRIGGCDIGCQWCDSKFSWKTGVHPLVDIYEILGYIKETQADSVVITGGEPLSYDMVPLTRLLKENGLKTFLETSGAYPLSGTWDWICLSPKKQSPPVVDNYSFADELKVIIFDEKDIDWAEENFSLVNTSCKKYLQPEWSRFDKIIGVITDYVMKYPKWEVSLQVHKFMHIP